MNSYRQGELDFLILASNSYYGKQMYFEQDDGTIYSRVSCKHMTLAQAVIEFCLTLGED